MELSTFSLLAGLSCYLVGLPLLLTEKKALAWLKSYLKGNDPLVAIVGAVLFLVAVLTLKENWRVTSDAEGLVTLVAWVALVKGLFIAWQPKEYAKLSLHVLTKHRLELLYGFLAVVWGALLTYLGFVLDVTNF